MRASAVIRNALPGAIALGLGIASGASIAADVHAGKQKATQICAACHGIDGNSPSPDFPKIGGQFQDYLAQVLRDYKSGNRKNPIMAGFAAQLSPKDIEDVSAYYATQPRTLFVRK